MGQLADNKEVATERLLLAVAEQIKTPLLHIARQAELSRLQSGLQSTGLSLIEATAERTIKFIDSYVLSTQLLSGQQRLELEPVSLSSALHDAAQTLDQLAKDYGCDIELRLSGKYAPVMAHRTGLTTALTNLGMVLIEAQSLQANEKLFADLSVGRAVPYQSKDLQFSFG